MITLAGGARYRLNDNLIAGIGYESPLTDREDIINWKFYADLVITFRAAIVATPGPPLPRRGALPRVRRVLI